MTGSARRIVLYPYGPPRSAEHRETCLSFMVALGGDIHRIIDGPFPTIDRFIRYASRIAAVNEGSRPLVVLTRTVPLAMAVLNARRKIETALPSLQRATWAIFVDPAEDPFFEAAAHKIGALQQGLHAAPIWQAPGGHSFLVLSPEVANASLVKQRGDELSAVDRPTPIRSFQAFRPEQPPPPLVRESGTLPAQGPRRPEAAPSSGAPPLRPTGIPWPWKR